MSKQNVDVVLRALTNFEPDPDAWLDTQHEEFVWYPIEEDHTPTRTREGALGVRQRWLESWEEHSIELEDIVDAGDDVVASVHLKGRGAQSGVAVDIRVHMHFKLRDDKITYTYEYADRDEALRAAGL